MNTDKILYPAKSSSGLKAALEEHGINVQSCYQCGRCSGGCPIAPHFDLLPMEVVRLSAMGMEEPIVKSHTIWLCASCETCTSRCPNGIDIAMMMDVLREYTLAKGYKPAEPGIVAFHTAYLNVIRRWGRIFEVELFVEYKTRAFDFFTDMAMGMKLFFQGKLRLIPQPAKDRKAIREIYNKERKEK